MSSTIKVLFIREHLEENRVTIRRNLIQVEDLGSLGLRPWDWRGLLNLGGRL